jgi:hypothetical protein
MDYLMDRLEALLIELCDNGSINKYDDIACGIEMLTRLSKWTYQTERHGPDHVV